MATYTEPTLALEGLFFETPISRKTITLAGSQGAIAAMTVLGADSSGNYVVYDDGITEGEGNTASAILLYEVDATSSASGVAIFQLAGVQSSALNWHDDADATAKSAAVTALASKMIEVRS